MDDNVFAELGNLANADIAVSVYNKVVSLF